VNRQDDLAAEGEPEKEFNPGIAARLPRIRIDSLETWQQVAPRRPFSLSSSGAM